MSKRQSFAAYGVSIESELDLGDDLRGGYRGGLAVRLEQVPHGHSIEAELRPLSGFETHGRTVTFLSDCPSVSARQGQCWQFRVDDELSFYWRTGQETIHYQLAKVADFQSAGFWFVHMVLPIILSAGMSMNFLHAAAVSQDGGAVAFLGPTGGGKSTLADFLIRRGRGLITDDKLAVVEANDEFLAVPSHARHRPYRSHEDLGKRAINFVREPRPLVGMFSLHRVHALASPEVLEVRGADRFAELNMALLYKLPFQIASQAAFLGRLANRVPLHRIHVPDSIDRLPEVCERISSAL